MSSTQSPDAAAGPEGAATPAKGASLTGNPGTATFSHADELAAYRTMLLIRRFEERAGQLYGLGHIGGYCHLSIGQEAVVTGLQMAARKGDQVIATYRHHGHMLACGIDPGAIMAELTGRSAGLSHGKGGSMHMFSRAHDYYGGHGIVGASVPLGAGLAFANKYRGNDSLCWCTFGDGATDQGQVHETFNLARRWRLPIVFVIENSKHAVGSAITSGTPRTELAQRGASFAIPGEQIDGMDVRAVAAAGRQAAARVRAGEGPCILEMKTFRYRGHSLAEPTKYSSKEEAAARRELHDPIEQVRARLLREGAASEDELKAIDKAVREVVSKAAELAQSAPQPDPAVLTKDVVIQGSPQA